MQHPRLFILEYIPFPHRMVKTVQEKYQRHTEVPRSILCSALYSMSLCLLSPASVVADCLMIVPIDLGRTASNVVISDERYFEMRLVPTFLTKNQSTG